MRTEKDAVSATWLLACTELRYPDTAHVTELCGGSGPAAVFTPLERAYSGARSGLSGWAGRLAAKRAIADLLQFDTGDPEILLQIEILPAARLACRSPLLCERGHPPSARLPADFITRLCAMTGDEMAGFDVSVSHDSGVAFAAVLGAGGCASAGLSGER